MQNKTNFTQIFCSIYNMPSGGDNGKRKIKDILHMAKAVLG